MHVRALPLLLLAASGLAVGACASSSTTVVESRELDEASGRPRVTAVKDVGGVDIPSLGVLRPRPGDGAVVIGETIWIRGSDFGRQPTVSIGGRSAAVVSRTADGGILARVPARTPAGSQSLVVSQEHGQGTFTISVRRLGGVVAGGKLAFFSVQGAGDEGAPRALAGGPYAGIRQLQISLDGRAAYALDDAGGVRVFDLPNPGGPAEVKRLDLGGSGQPPGTLLAASSAQRLLLLRKEDVRLFDTGSALHPRDAGGGPLPSWLRQERVLRASLSPDGRWLALALARQNRVVILDVDQLRQRGRQDARAGELPILPEVLAASLVDLSFAPDARTLWVLSGLTADNLSLGPRATQVHALRVDAGGAGQAGGQSAGGLRIERARVVALDGADRPVALSTGRSLPLESGSAVRLPPERATVFVSALAGRAEDGQPTIYAVGEGATGSPLLAEAELRQVGRFDVTPDGTLVVGAFLDRSGNVRVAAAPADGRPRAIRSTVILEGSSGADGALGETELRLQP